MPETAEDTRTVVRSFRFRLYPTVKQAQALAALIESQRLLYNAALEERIGAWKWERRSVSYFDQSRTLTECRDSAPELLRYGRRPCLGTLRRLDRSFKAFLRRVKNGETPGFPRFKSASRWNSVEWPDPSNWKFDEIRQRLHIYGLGDIKVRQHRPMRGTPRTLTIKREGRHWYATIVCVDVPAELLPEAGREVGIDVGIASLVATSDDGPPIPNERYGKRVATRLAAAQRDLARKKRGSNRRKRAVERVAAHHRNVRNQRRNYLHEASRRLVDGYDFIAHEDLRIANMVRRPKPRPNGDGTYEPNGAAAKGGLNKAIHDAGWGILLAMISYKAECAGRTVVAVDPRNTSQRCHECGYTDAANRATQAAFRCCACGHTDHADVNAAKNILRAGRAQHAASVACEDAA